MTAKMLYMYKSEKNDSGESEMADKTYVSEFINGKTIIIK
jgi:hypothetical protein